MKSYAELAASAFCEIVVADGYFGHRLKVGVALIGKTCVFVGPHGYYNSGMGEVSSPKEALWLISKNRQNGRITED
jgi:hypothetical protein